MPDQPPKDEEDEQLEFSLEIDHDPANEIALPPKEAFPLSDAVKSRSGEVGAVKPTTKEKEGSNRSEFDDRETAEERKRRRRKDKTSEDPEVEPGVTRQKIEVVAEGRSQGKETKEHRPDRSFPSTIQRGFYIRADHRGDQHVFADSGGKREIFQESGKKLRTRTSDAHVVKLMLDTAAHRGWSSINVKGSQEFRREAWLEGQARGIAVTGYKPTDLDLQELKNREQAYLRNEIVPATDRAITHDRAQSARVDAGLTDLRADRGGAPNRNEEPGSPNEQTRADRQAADYRDGIEGRLVEQGSRPYKDDPRNAPSPYIILQDGRGDRHTAWGVGLPDAMLKAGASEGDYVHVRKAGMEMVTKNVLREIDGRTARVAQEVERRAWDAEVLLGRDASHALTEQEGDERDSSGDGRRSHENAISRDIGRSVSSAERTLHLGSDRDVAVADAIEARARKYTATGRVAVGLTPELKDAAALDAYIERKVRQKYPNDPGVVQRAMQTARTKIGLAIARGNDLPQPRVVDIEEFDQARQSHDLQRSSEQIRKEPNHSKVREQDREQNKNQERNR